MPVVLDVTRCKKPNHDKASQRWRQEIFDTKGQSLVIELLGDNIYSQRAIDKLQRLHQKKQMLKYVFGHLLLNDDQSIGMRPISVSCTDARQWIHLTL